MCYVVVYQRYYFYTLIFKLGCGVDNLGDVMKISSTTSLICLF